MKTQHRIVAHLVLLAAAATQSGCVNLDVRLSTFISPDRGTRTATLPRGYAIQDLTIHRRDRIIGITHAHHPESRAVIVFFGGDTFRRSTEGGEALEILARNADVLLFDYPGYGDSTGAPTVPVILETALAVYDYAASLETSAGKKRVLYGFSLGGMVAAQVAGRRAADGLILEATAPNAESWVKSRIPWYAKPIVRPRVEPSLAGVDTLSALHSYRGEVLVLASKADRQAPASLSAQIHDGLRDVGVRSQLVRFDESAHGAIPHAPEYAPVVQDFIGRIEARR